MCMLFVTREFGLCWQRAPFASQPPTQYTGKHTVPGRAWSVSPRPVEVLMQDVYIFHNAHDVYAN